MIKRFSSIELFSGCGGLALGLEKAGFYPLLLNEISRHACQTLKVNRPDWNVVNKDIKNMDFVNFNGKVDLLSGGFPCQAFSYAGKRLGFEDVRGTMFFEFARALKEIQPKMFLIENVKGLRTHHNGDTLKIIRDIIHDLDYEIFPHKILNAVEYNTPQKRERFFLVGVKKSLHKEVNIFRYPEKSENRYNLKDALKAGELYKSDVPYSKGNVYSENKRKILKMIPPGGYWRDLPDDFQRTYMKKAYYSVGGRTGIARRLSWDEPSLTLLCSPSQKQTERCHPDETRPLTIREYARIQTFPDNWDFVGSVNEQYKQIGNAVPVNLAHAVGVSIYQYLELL